MIKQFSFEKTSIKDLIIINPFIADDERGCFCKFYEIDIFRENGIIIDELYEEDGQVSKKGVIRGLHFHRNNPQAKLLRVLYGEVLDVVVDLRKHSSTFGKWYSINLSSENKKMVYVPRGFAHGYLTLSDISIVSYLCDNKYSQNDDDGVIWNDKELNIDWNLNSIDEVILSQKDSNLQTFLQLCKKMSI